MFQWHVKSAHDQSFDETAGYIAVDSESELCRCQVYVIGLQGELIITERIAEAQRTYPKRMGGWE